MTRDHESSRLGEFKEKTHRLILIFLLTVTKTYGDLSNLYIRLSPSELSNPCHRSQRKRITNPILLSNFSLSSMTKWPQCIPSLVEIPIHLTPKPSSCCSHKCHSLHIFEIHCIFIKHIYCVSSFTGNNIISRENY